MNNVIIGNRQQHAFKTKVDAANFHALRARIKGDNVIEIKSFKQNKKPPRLAPRLSQGGGPSVQPFQHGQAFTQKSTVGILLQYDRFTIYPVQYLGVMLTQSNDASLTVRPFGVQLLPTAHVG